MGCLVWSRDSRAGWIRSNGDKDHSIIFVIVNFLVVAVELGISNNLVVFRYFAGAIGLVKAAFLQAARVTEVQWKVRNVGHII